ncbi:ATP-binding cassette domain-containing protein [Halorientalis litorea]|uniref:ATP-binding cassette domain-containing protein n=1 Tax=Halorientalis litorea TaxID=2931977 RepID=UPI001FF17D78|nr:ATP-binding cassette domain-containing protein [Halorientalis litorea]
MITVENLAVSRGDAQVLTDVSLSVADGEFVALVGPNGAGKTTLLQTVNGLLDPDAGAVTVAGRDVTTCSSREVSRLVATVPQNPTMAFDFSVADVVAMGRTPYQSRFGRANPSEERQRVERALARTDTAELSDRSVSAVSGGERRRVLLARALVQDTPALLLDEPTASLDINHRVRTLELVSDLVAEGKTAFAAIHDLDLAARYCDRLVLLADGEVRASGPPAEVLQSTHLGDAFGTDTAVTTDAATGTPSVTALWYRRDSDLRVHVLGGGPVATRAICRLVDAGATVTGGPFPEGDVAVETAEAHGIDAVTAPPFAAVPDAARERVTALLDGADVAVLAVGPSGPSNPAFELAADVTVPAVAVTPDGTALEGTVGWEEFRPAVTPDELPAAVVAAADRQTATADD